jgi:stringent starvation protein B
MAFPAPLPGEAGAAAKASPLRDASRGNGDGEARVVHLVTDGEETAAVDAPTDSPDDEPPRPSGGGARPALKRVK